MIDTQQKNVALSFEQLAQLAEFEARLSNLQNETKLAQRTYTVATIDAARLTKEVAYQTELLEQANAQLAASQAKVTESNDTLQETLRLLSEARTEHQHLRREHEEQAMAHKEREDALVAREHAVAAKEQVVATRSAQHEADKKVFGQKVEHIKQALAAL